MADRPLVLVVDDTEQIRMLLRVNLELEGFDVEEAEDGAQALRRLRAAGRPPVDAVTIDAVMEGVDGWATIREIRADPALQGLPVVMITASVQAHHRAKALSGGVDAFVAKPFEPDDVVELVRELIGRSDADGVVQSRGDAG